MAPASGVPGPLLHRVAEAPEHGLAFVRTGTNERPAFSQRQCHDPVNVTRIDPVARVWVPVNECASPRTVRLEGEDLFDISTGQNGGLERPGMIMRIGVRLRPNEPMQYPAIIEMIFHKCGGHSLCANDRRARRSMIAGDCGDTNRHIADMVSRVATKKTCIDKY